MIDELFDLARAHWVKYDKYIWRKASDGAVYLTAAADAMPSITSPLRDIKSLVVDAVNIGRMCMGESRGACTEEEIRDAILAFAGNYGLLGLMTGLPTTPDFLDYDYVYFPKNRIIGRESMVRQDYVRMFFPFGEPDLTLSEDGTLLSLGSDIPMQALGMTFADCPIPVNMTFQCSLSHAEAEVQADGISRNEQACDLFPGAFFVPAGQPSVDRRYQADHYCQNDLGSFHQNLMS